MMNNDCQDLKKIAAKILREDGYDEEASFVDQLPDDIVTIHCAIDWDVINSILRMREL